ncbi:MAG: DUF2279 domain-containing protein [Bacteroidia bacterium]|nr:DUF2279 domain-containing protein [Bacteroidia bacterium]
MRKIIGLCCICLLVGMQVLGQDSLKTASSGINKAKLRTAIITESALYLGSMAYLQFIWYNDKERVPFHFFDDSKGYLQMDKMGHAYGAYLESYLSYKWLRSAGLSKNKALLFGGTAGIILQTPIEIFDGLYEGWGFSWSDMAANTAGSFLVIGQELLFDKQLFQYKFSFSRSIYAKQANGYLGDDALESLFLDYNGHSYWLSTRLNNFVLKDKLPDWLSIAVGYSANGMFGEFENRRYWGGVELPQSRRYRQFLLSPDIDWTGIPTKSRFLKGVFQALNFIKIPAPALEIDGLGRLKGHWLYF